MKKIKIIISASLILLWMAVIFIFSSMSGEESNAESKKIIKHVVEEKTVDTSAEVTNSNNQNIVTKQKKSNAIDNIIDQLNKILRKFAHASIYFVLSIFVMNFIFQIKQDRKFIYYIIAIFVCLVYACTDEFHQLYVDGRTGQFSDTLIDTAGAGIGCITVWVFCKIKNLIKNKIEIKES